jgi:hypothetical protein
MSNLLKPRTCLAYEMCHAEPQQMKQKRRKKRKKKKKGTEHKHLNPP